MAEDEKVPVLITDLTREEADLLLAVYDPITGMADADKDVFADLLNSVSAKDERVQELLGEIRNDFRIEPPNFEPVPIDEQPNLDELEPKFITCPHCGKEFDTREV